MKIPYKNTINSTFNKAIAHAWPFLSKIRRVYYQDSVIDSFFDRKKIFFVLGTGRSGTQLMSRLLNKDSNSFVLHEPDFHYDINVIEKSKNSEHYALKYITSFRKFSIYKRISSSSSPVYGEVTGTLRYHAEAIQKSFPNLKILIICRDGRDYVRSVLGWPQFIMKKVKAFTI